jgi:ABC-type Mn2+/Zn2+ transport system ATPase subunit
MNVEIKNCNNIESGTISIEKGKLNIKFGLNGIGKSTISKALEFAINPQAGNLSDLKPFGLYKDNPNNLQPEVIGAGNFQSILLFNEKYLNQFLYTPDDLILNSFTVIIRSDKYEDGVQKIEGLISKIKSNFSENESISNMIIDLELLTDSLKLTQTGLSKASDFYKVFHDGNKRLNIPEELNSYSPFLKNEDVISIKWLDWHIKGEDYLSISEVCPFCTYPLDEARTSNIKEINEVYDTKIIKKLSSIVEVVQKLKEYFPPETQERLERIITQKDGLEAIDLEFLRAVSMQAEILCKKLIGLQQLSAVSLQDIENVGEELEKLKIGDINLYEKLASLKLREVTDKIDQSLQETIQEVGVLQGEINKQRQEITKRISENEEELNNFLKTAGYKYKVVIPRENNEYKLRLQHRDYDENIKGGRQHLSYGEINAFGLALFMYEALSKNPDLIILDDPVSSFDASKKYAIMNMLFKGKKSFREKTVLMLTHDFEPIIDTFKLLHSYAPVSATFIKTSNGVMNEVKIDRGDVLTFANICQKIIISNANIIVKLIYLRRFYEIMGRDKSDGYQVLSNLLKARAKNECTDDRMTEEDNFLSLEALEKGIEEVKKDVAEFDYDEVLNMIRNPEEIKEIYNSGINGYEKIQLFRVMATKKDFEEKGDVFRKFINQSYHVENELICQLDHSKFDLVPEFIIKECDDYVANAIV